MIRRTVLLASFACLLPALAAAWNGVRLQDATARVHWEQYVDPSPVPVGWVYWDAEASNGVELIASYGDGAADIYPVDWFACCRRDSVVFRGAWPDLNDQSPWWRNVFFDVVLHVRVWADEGVRIVASREFAGNLSLDEHSVRIQDYGDLDVLLLGPDTGDWASFDVEPDSGFMLTVTVDALETDSHFAYAGAVQVRFEDPGQAPVRSLTLSAVKRLFD